MEGRILSGRLGSGEKLPSERGLSGEFGVSRPVVREALRGMADRGLIEVLPGSGAYVREARVSDAAGPMGLLLRRSRATPRDLVGARGMIECEAAGLASKGAAPGDLRSMERALGRFDAARDLIEKTRCDVAFHASIVRSAHNPVLETMFGAVIEAVAGMMMRSLGDPGISRAGLPFHRQIFDAIRSGRTEDAKRAVTGHLLVAERMYGEDYDRSLDLLALRELERVFGPDAVFGDLMREATAPERDAGSDVET